MERRAEIEHDEGTKLRTTPVAANGRLYYMTENPTNLWVIGAVWAERHYSLRVRVIIVFVGS